MKIKITVKKDTEAARIVKEYRGQKAAFKKAATEGRAADYSKTKKEEQVVPSV